MPTNHSLYNPFLPEVSLRGHAVFMADGGKSFPRRRGLFSGRVSTSGSAASFPAPDAETMKLLKLKIPAKPEKVTMGNVVAVGGKGFKDKPSYVIMSDGKRIESKRGSKSREVKNVKKYAKKYMDEKNKAVTEWEQKWAPLKEQKAAAEEAEKKRRADWDAEQERIKQEKAAAEKAAQEKAAADKAAAEKAAQEKAAVQRPTSRVALEDPAEEFKKREQEISDKTTSSDYYSNKEPVAQPAVEPPVAQPTVEPPVEKPASSFVSPGRREFKQTEDVFRPSTPPTAGAGVEEIASNTAGLQAQTDFGQGYTPGALQSKPTIAISDASTGITQTTMYSNERGQQIPVTIVNGQPITYVPPGFTAGAGYAKGGDVGLDGDYRLASKFLDYKGPKTKSGILDFIKANPGAAARMGKYKEAMIGMAKGGMVQGLADGGTVTGDAGLSSDEKKNPDFTYYGDAMPMFGDVVEQTMQPRQGTVSNISAQANQFLGSNDGQVGAVAPQLTAVTADTLAQAKAPTVTAPTEYTAVNYADKVKKEVAGTKAAQGEVSDKAQATAAQGQSSLDVQAAQGQAYMMRNPTQRKLQRGELISGAADAVTAAKFTEQIEAAEATPTKQATVQGQLEGLMQQFEGGKTPPWAAGAMRSAMGTMAARGLGASSMAGQAVVQAAMESALPIAQADAQTVAQFESQNLSNRQQRAMLAAQQRAQFMGQEFDQAFQARVANASKISDVANMNFTAEQQVALENARAANTMNLANLSNNQAGIMAEAAAIANMDMANLNNRQQTAVRNAEAFLQMDMSNLSNEQQTAMFKAQQNVQALFTDQAAQNAERQFNASSKNQTDQFFASLASQTSQFNATQSNAMDQFNVNAVNAINEFNASTQQQRDMFNATNGLVVAQANAQWRQNIATINTAVQNDSNANFAAVMNGLTSNNMDQIWQRERDLMSYNFTSNESAKDRALSVLMGDKELETLREKMGYEKDVANSELAFRFLFGNVFK